MISFKTKKKNVNDLEFNNQLNLIFFLRCGGVVFSFNVLFIKP